MKDFYGTEVKLRDKVICAIKNYRSLVEAEVIKITDKTVVVSYYHPNVRNPVTRGYGDLVEYRIPSDQFIIVGGY